MAEQLPHLTLTGTAATEEYVYPGEARGPVFNNPPRDSRPQHAADLTAQIEQAQDDADAQTPADEVEERRGITLEFQSEPQFGLWLESLENRQQGIELSNARQCGNVSCGTVFIPEGRVGHFLTRIEQYATENTDSGAPRHQRLIQNISEIRLATIEAFWTDAPSLFPQSDEVIWWEVWLRTGPSTEIQDETLAEFVGEAEGVGLQLAQQVLELPERHTVRFPERLVLLARGSRSQWASSISLLNLLAELRRAKEVATAYVELVPHEQQEWIDDACDRTHAPPANAPAVCLLDTGVNRSHPMLELALDEEHVLTVDPNWSAADHNGHGTEMAGIALYGCLTQILNGTEQVTLRHRLESVKILPTHGQNNPEHYGAITTEAISRAEVASPDRIRAVCLTVTADDRDGGLPTSWSAAIDQFVSGADDEQRRLVIVSGGNVDGGPRDDYPEGNRETHGCQDPAQAWNALTVGAFTEKVHITASDFDGWQPVAQHGSLCPSSTTSSPWEWEESPLKPDIVMEGGNCARPPESTQPDFVDDLSLLTTCVHSTGRLLTTTGETSAAAAQAARLAAIIQSEYPHYRPETIRGLIVHSAIWTDRMLVEFPHQSRQDRLRNYGYGVPDENRARWSASNAASLVIETQLQPFDKPPGERVRTKDIHFHALPWPVEVLESLEDAEVTMRITLSYFIEPSPGRRGWTRKHRFQSHGLRFDVKRPLESEEAFRQRLTRSAWEDSNERPSATGALQNWMIGPQLRTRGSIHSDEWTGTASELAASGVIGIYPVTGWWKERHHLGRWDRQARYSLIVSIETPNTEVDLYTAIQNEVAVSPQIEIS